MNTLKSLVAPLTGNTSPLHDTLKLVVIGGTVETARRVSASAWNGFVDSFFLTAHFSNEDYPYDWLLHWLSKQPAWGRSREFEITTRSNNGRGITTYTTGDLEEEENEEELVHGRRKRKVAFMPSVDTTHTIFYRGHWLRITRTRRAGEYGQCSELKVSVVARNNNILKSLVLDAKREYEKDAEHRVHIFLADTYGSWRWTGAKQKRPMSSIVLEPSVKEMLLTDCRDFLRSEDWYAERGIPYRRGYLLYGVPGSGKTSLIHSLAGELGLDIYVVSLSSKGMSDNTLTTLMGHVPQRCILLLEDLDAAFTRGVSRDASSTGKPTSTTTTSSSSTTSDDGSTLSLSGLLNALDGVAAAEGRLLFATTNHIERLDPALSRPGRCDVWVNFTNATKWQAEGLYKCFFPSKKPEESNPSLTPTSEKNIPVPRRKPLQSSTVVRLDAEEIAVLAKRFADAIPEDELSVASIQGFLLQNKTRPRECVDEVAAWVIKERETKAKLKKEKEEKEAKEKEEAEAKEKKEKEEKKAAEKKEKAEKKAEKAAEKAAAKLAESESAAKSETETKAEASSTSESDSSDSDSDDTVSTEGDSDKSAASSTTSLEDSTKTSEKWVAVKAEEAKAAEAEAAAAATTPSETIASTTTDSSSSESS
ncbi:P-loop containing nucleoside triphosphate hydrolase protein [Sistotremastrum suecicum HHB10207 ss-3]|uniref:p-loop containing nucleoside triphosphate hydrolase protein n=1 Tax=Sistotremastrum suecicum HHB10207 ss-3 TaxID=1314776 RepID=A0A166GJ61_9AGAM|nr:P-loop containing nucleoside triphosphate hydrolase protein [Sistotremastrum suecicum HHB10207 ss-3]